MNKQRVLFPCTHNAAGSQMAEAFLQKHGGEDVRKYAAEQGIAEEEVLKKGMEEKPEEFTEKGSELYAKT